MLGRTFASAFPDSMLVNAMSMSDFLLVGFPDGKNLDLKVAEKNAAYAQLSKNISIRDPKVLFNLIVTEDLKESSARDLCTRTTCRALSLSHPKTSVKIADLSRPGLKTAAASLT